MKNEPLPRKKIVFLYYIIFFYICQTAFLFIPLPRPVLLLRLFLLLFLLEHILCRSICRFLFSLGKLATGLNFCSVERARAGFATIKTAAAEEKFFTAAVGDESRAFIAYGSAEGPAGRV